MTVNVGMIHKSIALAEKSAPLNILLMERDLEHLLQFVHVYIGCFQGKAPDGTKPDDKIFELFLFALQIGEKTDATYTVADLAAVVDKLHPETPVVLVCEGRILKEALRGYTPFVQSVIVHPTERGAKELTFEIGLEK